MGIVEIHWFLMGDQQYQIVVVLYQHHCNDTVSLWGQNFHPPYSKCGLHAWRKVWLSCFYQSELSTLDNLGCLILAYTIICMTVARLFMQGIYFTIMMYHWNDSIWTMCFWSIWTNTFWLIGQVIHLLLVSIITYSEQSYFQKELWNTVVQPVEHGKGFTAFEQNWKCNGSMKVSQRHFLYFPRLFSLNLDSTDVLFVPDPHTP